MASTIAAAAPPIPIATTGARAPASGPSAGTAAAPSAQQLAALKQLVARYATDQSHNVAAATLSSLGRQIMAMAQTLNQHVTLPRGSASSGAAPATPVASPAQAAGKVNVSA